MAEPVITAERIPPSAVPKESVAGDDTGVIVKVQEASSVIQGLLHEFEDVATLIRSRIAADQGDVTTLAEQVQNALAKFTEKMGSAELSQCEVQLREILKRVNHNKVCLDAVSEYISSCCELEKCDAPLGDAKLSPDHPAPSVTLIQFCHLHKEVICTPTATFITPEDGWERDIIGDVPLAKSVF